MIVVPQCRKRVFLLVAIFVVHSMIQDFFDDLLQIFSCSDLYRSYTMSDEFSDDLGRFFTELGSGSPEEVPTQSADDEATEQAARK